MDTFVLNLHDIRGQYFHGESSTEVSLNVNEESGCRGKPFFGTSKEKDRHLNSRQFVSDEICKKKSFTLIFKFSTWNRNKISVR